MEAYAQNRTPDWKDVDVLKLFFFFFAVGFSAVRNRTSLWTFTGKNGASYFIYSLVAFRATSNVSDLTLFVCVLHRRTDLHLVHVYVQDRGQKYLWMICATLCVFITCYGVLASGNFIIVFVVNLASACHACMLFLHYLHVLSTLLGPHSSQPGPSVLWKVTSCLWLIYLDKSAIIDIIT